MKHNLYWGIMFFFIISVIITPLSVFIITRKLDISVLSWAIAFLVFAILYLYVDEE